jgi:VCBS repeat-containing protein
MTSDGPPSNSPPVANNDSYATDQDTPLQVAAPGVLGNDTDADGDPLTAVLASGPANGSLTLNANGSFSYMPAAGFSGTDGFTYRAYDGTANSNIATVEILVYEIEDENTAPVAVNDSYSTDQDTPLQVVAPGVLGNDTDADGDPLTAVLGSGPANGSLTLNANGGFSYTPAAGFSGTDSFTYRAHDGTAHSNLATVTITVTGTTFNAFVKTPSGANGYSTWGGRNSSAHLQVLITIQDGNGAPVVGASVTTTLSGPTSVTSTGTTNSNGQVEIKITNAPSGTYTTKVTSVSGSGVRWDGVTPANSYSKQ